MSGALDPLASIIARAAQLPKQEPRPDPYSHPQEKKHLLIIGATHLIPLSTLFPHYALTTSVIVPTTLPALDREHEMERAVQFEENYPDLCSSTTFARDLSHLDDNSADYLFCCTIYPSIRHDFLKDVWRIVKDGGKVLTFSPTELPLTYLASFGLTGTTYFPVEGFYAATAIKNLALYSKN